jgi:O-glycosyl hydrolase
MTPAATVAVNQSQQFQTVEGFGGGLARWSGAGGHSCAGSDTVPDSDKAMILDLLYTDLGLTGERALVGYQSGGGAFGAIQGVAPILAQAAQRIQANGDQLAYNLVGVVTNALRDPDGRLLPNGAATYASWAANGLTTLINQYSIVVNRWSIVNEPDGNGNITQPELKQLVFATGAAFQAAGLTTQIVVPQTVVVSNVSGYATPILSDPSTLPYVKQLDYHEYDYDASQGQSPDVADRNAVRDLATQYGLTVAQRETSTDVKQNQSTFWNGTYDQGMAWANDVMTDMVEANAAAWDLILADYTATPSVGLSSYVVMNYNNCVYNNFVLPPHYWTLRQFVKFVRPGAVRVGASSSSHDVRAAAFVDSKRQQTIVVAINNSTTDLGVAFTGTPSGSATVSTVTQATVNAGQGQSGAQTSQVTAQNGQFTTTLPARSVTTFVLGL